MTPERTEDQNDPFRPIRRPLISASNAEDYRSELLVSLYQAIETRRRVAERAAPTREARAAAGFQRGQFIDRLSGALTNRLHVMRQMVDVAAERREAGSHGGERAALAAGLVNWEYFRWIADFQKVPPQAERQTCPDCGLFKPEGRQLKCRSCDEIESASRWTACLLGKPLELSDFQPRDGQPRDEYASDCAVRALNEAIDGDGRVYGEIWNAITRSIRDLGYAVDADQGANWRAIHLIYESHGLRLIYEDDKIDDRFHRRLIDMREVSGVLGPLFEEHNRPLIYTVGTDVHYATVNDGALRDAWDSQRMGDVDQLGRAGRVKFLWIRSDDDELTERAHSRFSTYAWLRGQDMRGVRWR